MRSTPSPRPSAGTAPPFVPNALEPHPIWMTLQALAICGATRPRPYARTSAQHSNAAARQAASTEASAFAGASAQHSDDEVSFDTPHQTVALRRCMSPSNMQESWSRSPGALPILSTPKLRPARSSAPTIATNRTPLRYAGAQVQPAGGAIPKPSPKEAQYQTPVRRRRNTKPWPAGRAAPNHSPQDAQHQVRPAGCERLDCGPKDAKEQTVARRMCRTNALETKMFFASAAVRGASKRAASDTGLGAADAGSVEAPHELRGALESCDDE